MQNQRHGRVRRLLAQIACFNAASGTRQNDIRHRHAPGEIRTAN